MAKSNDELDRISIAIYQLVNWGAPEKALAILRKWLAEERERKRQHGPLSVSELGCGREDRGRTEVSKP